MPINPADWLVHASNLLLLVAYSVRDILWLRWFAVAAALTNIPFFLMQETILWPPVMWAGVFTVINLAQIWRIFMDRRPVKLSGDEAALHALGFQSIRPREFLALTTLGQWSDAACGEQLLAVGRPADDICIATSGEVVLSRDGVEIGSLEPGKLIGVTMVLTGDPSPVDAHFATGGRYIRWPLSVLQSFLAKRPDLRATVLAHVKQDIARKLYAEMDRPAAS